MLLYYHWMEFVNGELFKKEIKMTFNDKGESIVHFTRLLFFDKKKKKKRFGWISFAIGEYVRLRDESGTFPIGN